uniref:Uncharacterized protein n=1 Tax=Parascaris equorum TaxID=6256 RepID=A0A914R4Z8_PAREQ
MSYLFFCNDLSWQLEGNKRKKKEDLFHYTDRKAGRGYSDYANTIYPHRPYIWQPLRKLYWWNYMAVLIALILLMIDFEGFVYTSFLLVFYRGVMLKRALW